MIPRRFAPFAQPQEPGTDPVPGSRGRSSAASSRDSGSGQPGPASSARRMYLFTVSGGTFRLRAIARPLKPATSCSRRTSRTLRMDNPLLRHRESSLKIQEGSHDERLSRVAQLRGSDPFHRSSAHLECDHFGNGMGGHFALEMADQFRMESVIT